MMVMTFVVYHKTPCLPCPATKGQVALCQGKQLVACTYFSIQLIADLGNHITIIVNEHIPIL